jgi:hypothetical protein
MRGGVEKTLVYAELHEIAGGLAHIRVPPPLTELEEEQRKGRILPFVRGLRFSAQVIYFLRKRLTQYDLCVSWGHLLTPDGMQVSRECDIIVHSSRGVKIRWNGEQNPVMDFCFVSTQHSCFVVSCKSYLRRQKVDGAYCKALRPYVRHVVLFAECCAEHELHMIRGVAKRCGYEGFNCLYTLDGDRVRYQEHLWGGFLDLMERLARERKCSDE